MARYLFTLIVLGFMLDCTAQDTLGTGKVGMVSNFDTVSQTIDTTKKFRSITELADSIKVDTTKKVNKFYGKRHSPGKAAWMSAILPGLGQAYNKRWWKIPIVYAGFAGLGYGLYHFGTNYTGYRSAYRQNVDYDTTYIASYKGVSDVNELRSYRDFHKRNLDIMAVITAVWYALNIVDAVVDAHLFHWDVDDKLALDLHPMMPNSLLRMSGNTANAGLTLQLSFKQAPKRKIFQL